MNMKTNIWVGLLFFFASAGILFLNSSYYLPFFSDDSLISLRYASRLLEGYGLTWTEGRPVEGYSNLLWILLVACLGGIGIDLIDAARILGILGITIILLLMIHWYMRTHELRVIWFPLAIALLFLSASAPMGVWAIGGLEQPLCGALIAASVVLMNRVVETNGANRGCLARLSLVLGLLCITRPDGPIFSAACAASILMIGRFHRIERPARNSLLVLVFPVLFYLGQTLFRFFYYGELVPNTALVKITPSAHHLLNGLIYVGNGLVALFPFSVLAIASLVVVVSSSRTRSKGIYLLAISILWGSYLVFIGGDVFPAYRHFIPLITVFAFALVEGSKIAVGRVIELPPPKAYSLLALFGFLLFIPYTYIQFSNPENQRAIEERWEWQGREVALLLKQAFSTQRPLMAVTAAGSLPYWSELPALDMLGLNDYYLPRNPPENIGSGLLGHELGDGKYVLSQKPDIIVFHVGTKPNFRSGKELERMPKFHKRYSPILVAVDPGKLSAIVYFNKYSDKLGIQETQEHITIPGFFFKGKKSIARLNEENRLVSRLAGGQSVRVTFEEQSSKDWLIDVKASATDKLSVELKRKGGMVSIELVSKSVDPVDIEEVVLRSKSETIDQES